MMLEPIHLRISRLLNNVYSWCGWSNVKSQSLSDHVRSTAMMYAYLAERLGIKLEAQDILAALTHDNEEVITSDIPSPAKLEGLVTVHPGLKSLCRIEFTSEKNKKLHKICDIVDRMLFLQDEHSLGNEASADDKTYFQVRNSWVYMAKDMGIAEEVDKMILQILRLNNPTVILKEVKEKLNNVDTKQQRSGS